MLTVGAGYEGRLGDYIGVFYLIGGSVSTINTRRERLGECERHKSEW